MRFEREVNLFKKNAILKRFQANETAVSVVQGKISALISESELTELVNSEVTMYSKMASAILEIDSLQLDFSDLYSKYDSVTDQYSELDSKVASYKASVDGLSANISSVQQNLASNYSTTSAMTAAINASVNGVSAEVSRVETKLNNNYSTTAQMNAAISAQIDAVELSVSNTYATKAALNTEANKIVSLEEWKNEASVKITDSAIVSTVRSSSAYTSDLAAKVGNNEVISKINQTSESVSISAAKINFNGMVTANNYFKINTNGSFVAKYGTIANWTVNTNYIRSSDATITLYNNYNNSGSAAIQIGGARMEADGSAMVIKYGLHIYSGTDAFSDGTDKFRLFNLATASSGKTMVLNSNYVEVLSSSSKRYKDHVRDMDPEEVRMIYKLPVVWFSYKDGYLKPYDPKVGKTIPGFYAEDMAVYIPDAAVYDEDGFPEDWNERALIPYVVKALQELKRENEELKSKLAS